MSEVLLVAASSRAVQTTEQYGPRIRVNFSMLGSSRRVLNRDRREPMARYIVRLATQQTLDSASTVVVASGLLHTRLLPMSLGGSSYGRCTSRPSSPQDGEVRASLFSSTRLRLSNARTAYTDLSDCSVSHASVSSRGPAYERRNNLAADYASRIPYLALGVARI
ncbi:hypothetical protein EK21DRAFT_92625 [Setomelanomma holmii]|uniref:Uncharacterized protein n=1 Tax=Setomelanomma holmii TaxID=210430 RepID=A0A9P4H234_9PLEO|nr:hypothetical protein EK21DRAFT_92625 [Setomelanomma holmii]